VTELWSALTQNKKIANADLDAGPAEDDCIPEESEAETIPILYCKNIMRAIQNFHHQELVDLEQPVPTKIQMNTKSIGRLCEEGLLYKP